MVVPTATVRFLKTDCRTSREKFIRPAAEVQTLSHNVCG